MYQAAYHTDTSSGDANGDKLLRAQWSSAGHQQLQKRPSRIGQRLPGPNRDFDLFGVGEKVAVFGSFTYRSVTRGKTFRSPFSIHAKVKNGKIVHFQFMEDTFASGRSFSSGGTWTIKTDPNGPEYQV